MTMKIKQKLKQREAINDRLGKGIAQTEILQKLQEDVRTLNDAEHIKEVIQTYIDITLEYCNELNEEINLNFCQIFFPSLKFENDQK